MLLSDTVLLVTGSTTGIGEAIARRAVAEGAQVMIHGRDEARARAVAGDLGAAARYVVADLLDPAAPQQIVAATVDAFGRIDGLVNNAALTTRASLETADLTVFERLMAVNLRAPLFLIQAALPHFRRQGGGTVLNIGSVNALGGEPNLLVYSMTKGGLMTMTRNLAAAHATEHIRINQINVGWTLTENERQVKQEEGLPEGWEHRLPPAYAPFGRIFEPEEVAAHAVFWLSAAAGPVNGAVFELEQFPMVGRNPDKAV
ncbi:short-chain dehydrogenase [Rhodothermaceae bacterium RA]|nr:short-chain dehydrogenase [Rhodothermaceae bacterium RA]